MATLHEKVSAGVDLCLALFFFPWKWILGLFYIILSDQISGTIWMELEGIKIFVARLSTRSIYLVNSYEMGPQTK